MSLFPSFITNNPVPFSFCFCSWPIFLYTTFLFMPAPGSDRRAQAQVLLEAVIHAIFAEGVRYQAGDLWPMTSTLAHTYTDTDTWPGALATVNFWSVSSCRLSVAIVHACPMLPFLVGQRRPAALNCLNLWPGGFLREKTLRLQLYILLILQFLIL